MDLNVELLENLVELAPDATLIVDAAGTILYANRQVTSLFGYPQQGIVHSSIESLLPESVREQHRQRRRQFAENPRARPMGVGMTLFARRQDGTEFPVEISLNPLAGGLTAAAIRDISDRKAVERELVVAREAADRANQAKSRFLATASHDLRQPLQTLALLNGTLRRIIADHDAADALSQQDQAIGAMSRLLNALLDISKLESGAIKPEPTDFTVAALFEELRREFDSLAANKGLGLQVEPSVECIHSDPSLVEQILRNLVSNAIKYTRKGWVRVSCLHEAATRVRIEILDTGIGIPADKLPYIYDEFYQVGVPANRSREGYGLGLSIVQRLVKLLNLDLDVRSEVGKGSVFALLLPAATTSAISVPPPAPDATTLHSPQLTKTRVLLVEDDPAVRDATRMLLKVEGYQVRAVASFADALKTVREDGGVDLLVTDYHLGEGENGTEVICALREILGPALKAVLMTGDTSPAIKELPRDAHLRLASKPVKAEELLGLLSELRAGGQALTSQSVASH